MDTTAPKPSDTPSGDAPKKFIRTFAGDMDTFQKGGTPDLVPLEDYVKPSVASVDIKSTDESLAEEEVDIKSLSPISFPAFVPVDEPKPKPKPEIHLPEVKFREPKPLENAARIHIETPFVPPVEEPAQEPRLEWHLPNFGLSFLKSNSAPKMEDLVLPPPPLPPELSEVFHVPPILVDAPPAAREPELEFHSQPVRTDFSAPKPEPIAPLPEPIPAEIERPAPLQTYASDFRDRMQKTSSTTATVLAAEQDAGGAPSQSTPEESGGSNKIPFIIAGIILLVAGGVGAYIAFSKYSKVIAPVVVAPVASTPIFVDSRENISGKGKVLMQEIKASVEKSIDVNSVQLLQLDPAPEDASVFGELSTHAPGILVRNVNVAGSMAGVVNRNGTQSPFFILGTDEYGATFSGMLSWEPVMQADLALLFPLHPASSATIDAEVATATTSLATTTKIVATSIPLVQESKVGFRDEVISNHDVRVYRDAQNRSVIVYGYWDQKTLVIARDSISFAEILARLATSHSK